MRSFFFEQKGESGTFIENNGNFWIGNYSKNAGGLCSFGFLSRGILVGVICLCAKLRL